jgi:hypothetical protein
MDDDDKLEVNFMDSEKKRVSIDGVKYIRCWKSSREKTIVPKKCRKEYMVQYRQRKRDELRILQTIVEEKQMEQNSEVVTCATDFDNTC